MRHAMRGLLALVCAIALSLTFSSANARSAPVSNAMTTPTGTGCTPGQIFGNPGFETGQASPWTTTAGVINGNGSGETARTGSYFAWLDGYGTTHTDTLSQQVSIPTSCHAILFFWLHVDTQETTTVTAYDTLTVTANSTTLGTYSNLNANTGYVEKAFDLSSMAGQTVTITFTGTEDNIYATSFVIDDTALQLI